jgi:hypothetical protein
LSKTLVLSFRLLIIQLNKKKKISKNKVIKPSKHYDVGCKLKRLTRFDLSLSKMLLSWYFFFIKNILDWYCFIFFFFWKSKDLFMTSCFLVLFSQRPCYHRVDMFSYNSCFKSIEIHFKTILEIRFFFCLYLYFFNQTYWYLFCIYLFCSKTIK